MSLRNLWRLLNLPCDGITELMSREMEEGLSGAEWWAVKTHALYCRACRRYRTQIVELKAAVRRFGAEDVGDMVAEEGLGDGARARMTQSLREGMRD